MTVVVHGAVSAGAGVPRQSAFTVVVGAEVELKVKKKFAVAIVWVLLQPYLHAFHMHFITRFATHPAAHLT